MQPYSTPHSSGSTRGFTTVDPERQGVLVSGLGRGPLSAPRAFKGTPAREQPAAAPRAAADIALARLHAARPR